MTRYCFYAAIVYLIFVIYGSLVPFDHQNVPWQEAQDRFKNIPYLDLGIESRADWIANIVLYIPLAFLWSSVLGNVRSSGLRFAGTLLVLCACLLLAVGVEFFQLYFPPRTVSINDLIAESIGTAIGLLVSQIWGRQLLRLCKHLPLSELLSVEALIKLYLLAYILLSFFPYDFVASFAELEVKLESGNDHIFMSIDACSNEVVRCTVKFLVEIGVLVPLGGLIYLLPHVSHKLGLAVLIGFFLGIFSEVVQLFLFSGIAQGLSILTRMLGMGLGVIAADWLCKQKRVDWQHWLKPFILAAVLPYFALVFIISGGLEGGWLSMASASAKLAETRFLPFYYFYYTTETIALVSLISNIGIYMPIGVAYRLWHRAQSRVRSASWILAGFMGAGLAILVETEKLFLADKHPDPTDVWIAFTAAAGSYVLMNKAMHWFSQETIHNGNRSLSTK